jgi:hypothetical protein
MSNGELSPGTAPSSSPAQPSSAPTSSPSPAPARSSPAASPPERRPPPPNPRAQRREHWSDKHTGEGQFLAAERARREAAERPSSPGAPGRDTAPGAAPGEQRHAAEIGPITRTENGRYKFSDDLELSEADVRGLIERHALEQNRKAAMPADPSGYELKLPADFVVPQGVEFRIDENNPLLPHARQLAHDIDAGKIGAQEALSRLLGLHGASEIARVQQFDNQVRAEVQKLGATGTARITTIQNFIKSIAPEDTIRDLYAGLISEKAVRGWEALMRRFESQGAGSFSHAHREA